jgi:hypothetical protein
MYIMYNCEYMYIRLRAVYSTDCVLYTCTIQCTDCVLYTCTDCTTIYVINCIKCIHYLYLSCIDCRYILPQMYLKVCTFCLKDTYL